MEETSTVTDIQQKTSHWERFSTTDLPYERAEAGDDPPELVVGGLNASTWQAIIWIIAGAMIAGVLLTLAIAYFQNRSEAVGRGMVYSKSSLAAHRERLLSADKALDMLDIWERERRISEAQQQFLESQRYGRRNAMPRSSIHVEIGSMNDGESVRSGVTNISTPNGSETKLVTKSKMRKKPLAAEDSDSSMLVLLGDRASDTESVPYSIPDVETPVGSLSPVEEDTAASRAHKYIVF